MGSNFFASAWAAALSMQFDRFFSILTKIGTLAECIEIDIAVLLVIGRRDATARGTSMHNVRRTCEQSALNIIILDDYQDAVRKLKAAANCSDLRRASRCTK